MTIKKGSRVVIRTDMYGASGHTGYVTEVEETLFVVGGRRYFFSELEEVPDLYTMTVDGDVIYGHATANVISEYWQAYADQGYLVEIQRYMG